jgi:hypothetical protein
MVQKTCLILPVAAFFMAITSASAQDAPLFHFTEAPGPDAVGLRVVEQYDYSRTYRPATDDWAVCATIQG